MFILPSGRGSMKKPFVLKFTPDGGSSAGGAVNLSDLGILSASVTITCSSVATWSWVGSDGSVSVANNASATAITFSLATAYVPRSTTYTVNGTSNGVTKYYNISLECTGTA